MKDEKVFINLENEAVPKKVKKFAEVAKEEKEKMKSYITEMKKADRCKFLFKIVFFVALFGVVIYLMAMGVGYYSADQQELLDSIRVVEGKIKAFEGNSAVNQQELQDTLRSKFETQKEALQDVETEIQDIKGKSDTESSEPIIPSTKELMELDLATPIYPFPVYKRNAETFEDME